MFKKSIAKKNTQDSKEKFRNIHVLICLVLLLNYTLFVLKMTGNNKFNREYPDKYNGISYIVVPLISVLLVFAKCYQYYVDRDMFSDVHFSLVENTVYILFAFIMVTNITLLSVNHREDVISSLRSIRSMSPI